MRSEQRERSLACVFLPFTKDLFQISTSVRFHGGLSFDLPSQFDIKEILCRHYLSIFLKSCSSIFCFFIIHLSDVTHKILLYLCTMTIQHEFMNLFVHSFIKQRKQVHTRTVGGRLDLKLFPHCLTIIFRI